MQTESSGRSAPNPGEMPIVLCVDDEPETLRALRRCFRDEPYRVFTAHSPWEALVWMECLPAVDLVLADQRMPGMAGTELLALFRDRHPATARAVLSGYPGEDLVRRGLEAGAGAFFTKPWDGAALRATVRRILQGIPSRPSFPEEGDGDSMDLTVKEDRQSFSNPMHPRPGPSTGR